MDRDSEHSDRAARGRRIFDALRRSRSEGEGPEASAASPGEDVPATTTAVDERPDDGAPGEDEDAVVGSDADGSGTANQAPPPPPPAAPSAPDSSGPAGADAGERHGRGDDDGTRAVEASETENPTDERPEPSAAAPEDAAESADTETAGADATLGGEQDDDVLPGADNLRAQLGGPEAPTAPPAQPPAVEPAPETAADGEATPTWDAVERERAPTEDEPTEAEPAPPRSEALPRVIAIANQKGGVGKTTTAVNLGASLSELGYRVLIVDLDPQGNATTGLGIDIRNLDGSVYDSVMGDHPLEDCVEATSVRNLFVAPSNMDLAGAEIELVPVFSRELKLRRAIEGVKAEYDFVLIDCPPSLGLLTVNGLAAADDVIVPIQCEYYALEGLGQLVNNVNLVRSNLNPVLDIRGIVLTMYDARTKLADQVVNEVRTHFGERCYETVVPRTVRLSEAPSFGQPIIVFDQSSRGSDAYRGLAQEVAERVAGRPRDPVVEENDRDD